MPVNASMHIGFTASKSGTVPNIGNSLWAGTIDQTLNFANGTGANQADLVYMAERTIASATTDSIDLNGVLTDAQGATITAVELVALTVMNKNAAGTANTTNLVIGGGTTNQIPGFSTAIATIKPGGMFLYVNPDATGIATITAATGDILPIVNSTGAAATYQIAALCRSV